VRRLSPWSCHNQSALSRTYLRPATKMHALRAKSALSPFLRPFRRVDVLWSSWCAHQRTVSCTQTGATHTLPRLVATCGHARRCWCSSRSPLAVRWFRWSGLDRLHGEARGVGTDVCVRAGCGCDQAHTSPSIGAPKPTAGVAVPTKHCSSPAHSSLSHLCSADSVLSWVSQLRGGL
jgi:hypothetical protein